MHAASSPQLQPRTLLNKNLAKIKRAEQLPQRYGAHLPSGARNGVPNSNYVQGPESQCFELIIFQAVNPLQWPVFVFWLLQIIERLKVKLHLSKSGVLLSCLGLLCILQTSRKPGKQNASKKVTFLSRFRRSLRDGLSHRDTPWQCNTVKH